MSAPSTEPIRDLDAAARRVLAQLGAPLHVRATIAALESEGLRDVDAAALAPGCPSLFELGPLVHERCLALGEAAATLTPAPARAADTADDPPARPLPGPLGRLARDYWLGIAYLLPLIAQGLCLLFLGVSLWGSAQLTRSQVTAIGAALVASLVLTGPFTHAMTHRLFHYWFQDDLAAVRRTAMRWTAGAMAAGAAAGLLAAGILAAAGRLDATGATFAIVLALQPGIWMANSALFVIRRAQIAAVGIALATIPVWMGLRAGLPPLAVHAAGLAGASLLLVAGAWVVLRCASRGAPPARRPLPRAVLPIAVAGYAVYGLVYFSLIFADRIVAWAGPHGLAWRPEYEAALQVALVPLLLTLPLLEHLLERLGQALRRGERAVAPGGAAAVHRAAEGVFLRLLGLALAAYAAMALVGWAAVARWGGLLPFGVGRLIGAGEGRAVLLTALVAYGFFVLALGIGAAFQLLGRPWPMAAAGALALVVDVAVGVGARLHGPPGAASLGLLAGGVAFALAMAGFWLATRRRLGYWWYAAG